MSGFVSNDLQIAQSFGWLDQLERLLVRELAPSRRIFRTALRISTIATIGAGLIASCHVNNQYGTYFVWLVAGAGPMLSARRAAIFLIVEAFALAGSVVMARTLVRIVFTFDLLRNHLEARCFPPPY
jgi:flagellar biosynthesis protein FliP